MNKSTSLPALKYEVEIQRDGLLNLHLPFQEGAKVTVFVIENSVDPFQDLLLASESGLDFWDNSIDDEEWNNA